MDNGSFAYINISFLEMKYERGLTQTYKSSRFRIYTFMKRTGSLPVHCS